MQYECPRCGYNTYKKDNMRSHLYKRKSVCNGIINRLVLTDEIKTAILENRIYEPKQQMVVPYTQTVINNIDNNNIINFIADMDTIKKIT